MEMGNTTQFVPGLEGVVAVETELSFLDTAQGEIVLKGYDLIELSKTKSYLDIVHLLLEGTLPNDAEKKSVGRKFKEKLPDSRRRAGHFEAIAGIHPPDGCAPYRGFSAGGV